MYILILKIGWLTGKQRWINSLSKTGAIYALSSLSFDLCISVASLFLLLSFSARLHSGLNPVKSSHRTKCCCALKSPLLTTLIMLNDFLLCKISIFQLYVAVPAFCALPFILFPLIFSLSSLSHTLCLNFLSIQLPTGNLFPSNISFKFETRISVVRKLNHFFFGFGIFVARFIHFNFIFTFDSFFLSLSVSSFSACRCTIRENLRANYQLPSGINMLKVPKSLKRYIDLMD